MSKAKQHLPDQNNLVEGPAVGEVSIDVDKGDIPIDDELQDVIDKLATGDENPCWIAMEIYEGEGSHGYYTEGAIQAVVDGVNSSKPMGFRGHQKPENLPFEFPDPTTHWFAAEMIKSGNKAVAKVYGLIDQAFPNLRRWVRSRRIKEVSIYGEPKYESGTSNVVDYNLYSIDWAPRNRAGMTTKLAWASEMHGEIDKSTWTKSKAEEWLQEHDFSTSSYDEMVNWHAFRQEDPDKYDSLRTDTSPFDFNQDDGVNVIYGILQEDDEETTEVQSIRFYHGKAEAEGEGEVAAEYDGSFEEFTDIIRNELRNHFSDSDYYVYIYRCFSDHIIVEYTSDDKSGYWWIDFTVDQDELGRLLIEFSKPEEVEINKTYVKVGDEGGSNSMGETKKTTIETLADIRAEVAKKELTVSEVLAELGITGEQALEVLDDDRLTKLQNAADLGKKLVKALGFTSEMEVDKVVETAEQMSKVYDQVEDVDNVGEMVKVYQEKAEQKNGEVLNEVIKDKVTGEQAQALIKRLIKVDKDADKEAVAGEVDTLLEDEEIKGMLSRLYTDKKVPTGENVDSTKKDTGFKSGRSKRQRV